MPYNLYIGRERTQVKTLQQLGHTATAQSVDGNITLQHQFDARANLLVAVAQSRGGATAIQRPAYNGFSMSRHAQGFRQEGDVTVGIYYCTPAQAGVSNDGFYSVTLPFDSDRGYTVSVMQFANVKMLNSTTPVIYDTLNHSVNNTAISGAITVPHMGAVISALGGPTTDADFTERGQPAFSPLSGQTLEVVQNTALNARSFRGNSYYHLEGPLATADRDEVAGWEQLNFEVWTHVAYALEPQDPPTPEYDFTTRLLQDPPFTWTRGADLDGIHRKVRANTFEFTLHNIDGALNPAVVPFARGDSVELEDANGLQFTGYITDFKHEARTSIPLVSVSAVSNIARLVDMDFQLRSVAPFDIQSNVRLDTALHYMLDAVDWPDDKRNLDVASRTLNWWPVEPIDDILQEIDNLIISEGPGAVFFEGGDGTLHFHNINSWIPSATAFGGTTGQPIISEPVLDDDEAKLINTTALTLDHRVMEGPDAVIWETDGFINMNANEVQEYIIQSDDPFILGFAGQPYFQLDVSSGITVELKEYTSTSAVVHIIAGIAGGSVNHVALVGNIVSKRYSYALRDQRTSSIISSLQRYGIQYKVINAHRDLDNDDAQNLLNWVAARHKDGRAEARFMSIDVDTSLLHTGNRVWVELTTLGYPQTQHQIVKWTETVGRGGSKTTRLVTEEAYIP